MERWEYKFLAIEDSAIEKTVDILNVNGGQGWEFTGHTEDSGWGMTYLMKRKVADKNGSYRV